MDASLDDIIKKNPKKFGMRRNKAGGGAVGKANKQRQLKTNKTNAQSPLKRNALKNGRVQKRGKANGNAAGLSTTPKKTGLATKKVKDARLKLLQKKTQKIADARERITSRITDARQKLDQLHQVNKKPGLVTAKNRNKGLKPLGRSNTLVVSQSRGGRRDVSAMPVNSFTRALASALTPPQPLMKTVHRRPDGYSYVTPDPYHLTRTIQNDVPIKRTIRNTPRVTQRAMDEDEDMDYGDAPYMPPPPKRQPLRAHEKRTSVRSRLDTSSSAGYKVYVTNLHPNVSEEDILELFGDIGVLIKAELTRPGQAEIVYTNRGDSLRAVEVYHNRLLDSLPMKCSLAQPTLPSSSSLESTHRPAQGPTGTVELPRSGKANVEPDIGAIHKALFSKNGTKSSQSFTVTLPKQSKK